MFKQASNESLVGRILPFCLYIEREGEWISAVILTKDYAVTTLHGIPESFRHLGVEVVLCDSEQTRHKAHIHGINSISDYVVLKKDDGTFDNAPDMVSPMILGKYIAVGFVFGEKLPSLRTGHVSSLSSGSQVAVEFFYQLNGALMGISRSSNWSGRATHKYGDMLEIVSCQTILGHIEFSKHQPFSV